MLFVCSTNNRFICVEGIKNFTVHIGELDP